jgi:hypothetical protein
VLEVSNAGTTDAMVAVFKISFGLVSMDRKSRLIG